MANEYFQRMFYSQWKLFPVILFNKDAPSSQKFFVRFVFLVSLSLSLYLSMNNPTPNFDSSKSSSRPFNTHEVKGLLAEIVDHALEREKEYDCEKCTQLSKDLSQIIKDALKNLNYDRYKYVIQVILGQSQDENLMMTCRCLWDLQSDNYVSYIYSNKKVVCAVAVFGLFYY